MGTQHCFAVLDVCAMRVASLTSVGRPDPGANKGYITDQAMKLDVSVVTTGGRDLERKNGCGKLIAAFKEPDKLKRLDLALDLSLLDAELLSLLAGFTLFTSAAQTVGAQFPSSSASAPNPVCLEVWCKAIDGDEPAVTTFTGANVPAYFCFVFPKTTWVIDKFTIDASDFAVIPVSGQAEDNTRITINGPWDDWPSAISTAGGITACGGWFFDDALPTPACGRTTLPGAAS